MGSTDFSILLSISSFSLFAQRKLFGVSQGGKEVIDLSNSRLLFSIPNGDLLALCRSRVNGQMILEDIKIV